MQDPRESPAKKPKAWKKTGDLGSEDREIDLHDVAILIWNMENK